MAVAPELTDRIELLGSYWTSAGRAYPHMDREYSPFDFRDRVEALAQARPRRQPTENSVAKGSSM